MAKLTDLLRYKEKLEIYHPKNEKKKIATVWVKILGDEDLQKALRLARIASANKRAALRDKESDDYLDVVAQLQEQPREVKEQLILSAAENRFVNEAPLVIDREDLPEVESVAVVPDAPTLEEQERLDEETEKVNQAYREGLQKYVDERLEAEKALLSEKDDDEIFQLALTAMAEIQPLQTFVEELSAQRGFRAVWSDEACKVRSFDNVDEFKQAHEHIKKTILGKYDDLDLGADDLKN